MRVYIEYSDYQVRGRLSIRLLVLLRVQFDCVDRIDSLLFGLSSFVFPSFFNKSNSKAVPTLPVQTLVPMSNTSHAEHEQFPSKPRPLAIHLPRINISCPNTPSYTSSISSITTSSSSSSRAAHTKTSSHTSYLPSAYQQFRVDPSLVRKRYPDPIQTANLTSLVAHAQHSNSQTSPGQPPLSARSASFVLAMQHCSKLFSTVLENYLHNSTRHTSASGSSQTTCFRPIPLLEVNPSYQPLSNTRRAIILISSLLLAISILAPALLLPRLQLDRSRMGTRLVMGSSSAVMLLSATIMLSARRSAKEILAMAAVGVTICQCVMGNMNSGS
jgi:hypothetical protein